jgi:hypothetical protein
VSRDLGDLARGIEWAALLVNAALPLNESRTPEGVPTAVAADRAAFRAVAFASVLHAMIPLNAYTATPAVLEALIEGRMPPVTGDPS